MTDNNQISTLCFKIETYKKNIFKNVTDELELGNKNLIMENLLYNYLIDLLSLEDDKNLVQTFIQAWNQGVHNGSS